MLFQHPPDVELKLGLEVKIGDIMLGTIIGACVFEDGNVLVKLRMRTDPDAENPPPRPVELVNE